MTRAWSLFFAGQLAGSLVLLVFAPRWAWSLFVNVVDLPLVAAMFGAEFTCRKWMLRGYATVGMIDAIRAFARRGDFLLTGG